ncbi:hypothetical protein TIFTF001_045197 [Ficus carica]|uniref:Uncharacterized protein n=1 Tax=Ficus carica TaxID=3494 RepID=A0AA88CJ57_FICCA|nr:hypothetical protein TIFTF001_045197 [Ficus carica]
MGVGGWLLRLVGCQYNRCQTTNDHLGHDMEAGAGAIFSRGGPSTPSSGHLSTRFRQSYRLLGQMGVPKAAAIRAEKAVRWSEMIGSSTKAPQHLWTGRDQGCMFRCKLPGSTRSRFTLGMNRQVVGYSGAWEF